MTNSINNNYGNIQRLGIGPNNRMGYRVIDSEGNEAGTMSIPVKDVDTFEKSYIALMETAPKIKEYTEKNSTPEKIKEHRMLSAACIASGGILGVLVPLILTRNSGTVKKVFSTLLGIITGFCGGFAASFVLNTPQGMFKFLKATKELSKIDIKSELSGEKQLQATRM